MLKLLRYALKSLKLVQNKMETFNLIHIKGGTFVIGKSFFQKIDYVQLLLVLGLATFGLMAIASAQTNAQYDASFVQKQVLYYSMGFVMAFIVMQLESTQIKTISWFAYWFGVASLAFLVIAPEAIAEPVNGAKCWYQFGPISIQPSEFMKIFLIITLATIIDDHKKMVDDNTVGSDLRLLGKMCFYTAIPLFFIHQQPDFGTSLVMIAILVGMIFVSGITWRLLLPIVTVIVGTAGTLLYLAVYNPDFLLKMGVDQYQLDRINSWLHPWEYASNEGYQLVSSLTAIGSGGLTGKGFGEQQVYIPEAHSDFVFCIIGEEWGFIGGATVILLYFMLIYRWTKIALASRSEYSSYVAIGVISMFTFHVLENIGMTLGLLPITGIPLPFVSYGGSSLWGSLMALGIMFSISYENKVSMFTGDY